MFYVIEIFIFGTFHIATDFYNNKSHTSLCLVNNVFLFGQKEIVSVSCAPSSSITSFNHLIFYFLEAIFSGIFYIRKTLQSNLKILNAILF